VYDSGSANMKRLFIPFIAIVVIALASCASSKTLNADEVRSNLLSARSLTTETELFIEQIESGRVAPQFRAGHADFLGDEAKRQAKELRESTTETGAARTLALCAEQLELVAHVLASVRERSDARMLAEARQRLEAIRKSLSTSVAAQ
jgi:hypothetical protein